MKLRIIAVGRVREAYVAAACDDYRTRLRRYVPLDEIEVAASHGGDAARATDEEGARVLARLDASDVVWLLERTGDQIDSRTLAARTRALADAGTSRLVVVVAGTYGASDALLARATFRWSLSALTFLHEWARALVLEQLYRAAKIERNEPYHH